MSLPRRYAGWLTELIGGPPPAEPKATCHDCVMCRPEVPEERAFNPRTRCCTYIPRLPNFLAGALLADPDPALEPGRASLRPRLTAPWARPLGVELSPDEDAAYDRLLADEAFGQSLELACPHQLADGRCGVWSHRNGICATWFCRHTRGAVGATFWDAVQRWLTACEAVLAEAACEAAYGAEGLPWDFERALAGDFGPWPHGPAAFYRACAQAVRHVRWSELERLGGRPLRRRARAVRAAHRALDDHRLPKRLWLGPYDSFEGEGPTLRLLSHSGTDWAELAAPLLALLERHDGQRTPELLGALRAAGEPDPRTTLHALVDQGVLRARRPRAPK